MAVKALEVRSLTKKIKNKLIVDDVSFVVEKGEVFGLLGPNGAGKTTIIRMILGLIRRTKGSVFVNGLNLDNQFKETMSEIGAIVENPEFYKYMSGYKNLKHYANMARNVTEERIMEVTRLLGLEQAIHQKVKTYSLGMRQRLGVAQALLHNPSLLILDEPTNGLDPQGIREIRNYLRSLTKNGISVIVSSHLLSEMQQMCDRFAIIEHGKLIHISSMHESLNEEGQFVRNVVFEVSDVKAAVQLFRENDLATELKMVGGQQFSVNMDKETIALANQLLVKNHINVYGINLAATTLEDRFLELTGKGNQEVKTNVLSY